MMKLQTLFNKVVTHLLTQSKRCVEPGFGCRYRDSLGRACAVGCLIPDDDYTPTMEGKGLSSQLVEEALIRSGVLPRRICDGFRTRTAMLYWLQRMHDFEAPRLWPELLRVTAKKNDLNTSIIDRFEKSHLNNLKQKCA